VCRDAQIATSGLPSPLPPNQAAINSLFFNSTIVEAWLEANEVEPTGKMNSLSTFATAKLAARPSARAQMNRSKPVILSNEAELE
jgi:hypothetical protein